MFDLCKRGSAVALFLALAPAVHASTGAQPVRFGDTISSPGRYYLDGDQYGSGTGIRIEANYVTLDLGPYVLCGDGSSDGIEADYREGLKILNGTIMDFDDGIDLDECRRSLIKNVHVSNCTGDGVDLDDCEYVWVGRTKCTYNDDNGVELQGCSFVTLFKVIATHNGDDGIDLRPSDVVMALGEVGSMYNLVQECDASYNDDDGIDVHDSSWNRVVGNRCSGNADVGIVLETDGVVQEGAGGGGGSNGEGGSNYNVVRYNECARNYNGVVVEEYCHGNFLSANQALWSANQADLVEGNYDCSNFWYINLFFYAGGPGANCIE